MTQSFSLINNMQAFMGQKVSQMEGTSERVVYFFKPIDPD
jgi:hypothetical protein